MTKRRVLVVGAAGTIASQLLPAFRERYDCVFLDKRAVNAKGEVIEDIVIADLLQRDRDAYRHYFRGVDAVVHCGFVRAASEEERYWAESANVDLAYNIYKTSLEEGVRRVVVASSNHAADYYERLIWSGRWGYVTPETYPLSDNYYGWAKIAIEALGFVFASGGGGDRPLENVQIRIGAPRETDIDNCALGDMTCVHRALGAYISQRDMVQLFIKSIETEDIRNEFGVPFQVFYGISDNPHAFWDIANARRVIGYAPQDNSELRFAEQLARHIAAAKARA